MPHSRVFSKNQPCTLFFLFYQAYVPFICGLLGHVLIGPIIMNLLKCLIFILFEKVKPGILQKPWYFSLRIQDRDKKKEKIMILFSLQSRLNYNFHCAIRKHMFASLVAQNWIKAFLKEYSFKFIFMLLLFHEFCIEVSNCNFKKPATRNILWQHRCVKVKNAPISADDMEKYLEHWPCNKSFSGSKLNAGVRKFFVCHDFQGIVYPDLHMWFSILEWWQCKNGIRQCHQRSPSNSKRK